ncbi:MAG: 50S ribosomal protein L11 methyltransferase [Anaeromyxobacter sp.]|nr:50S ribosomal protein L11 methyltransferase [Anaeromyxobacter sp.]
MPSFTVTFDVDRDGAEDLSAALWDEGASGVEVRDGEGTPMPGLRQPAPGRALVVAYFAGRDEAEAAAAGRAGELAELPDQDWSETWKQGLAPLSIGRAFVRPSWIPAQVPEGMAEIVLDPGMAFGTGTHPTTSLCLAALSDLLQARPGARVLDVGTGSGLLAIAARKLGGGVVAGNDNDPIAVRVAQENAALNGVALDLNERDVAAQDGPFDLVLANILANTLVELAPALAAQLAPGGVVILSGILRPQEEEVRAAYLAAGLVPLPGGDRRQDEWSLLALQRVV